MVSYWMDGFNLQVVPAGREVREVARPFTQPKGLHAKVLARRFGEAAVGSERRMKWWRRWESKTADFDANRASTGNHRKPDPEASESKHEEKQFRETVLPSGKIEHETTQGRADVGDVPTAKTLGRLARKVISKSRHAESRELVRAVLQLLAGSTKQA